MRRAEGNLIFSPLSISTAVAMTATGAGGNTAEQMAGVMHFSLPPHKLHSTLGLMLKRMSFNGANSGDRGYQLSIANSLWGQAGFAWKDSFLKQLRAYYAATLQQIDFAAAPRKRQQINACREPARGPAQGFDPGRNIRLEHTPGAGQRHLLQGQLGAFVPQRGHIQTEVLSRWRQERSAPLMQMSGKFRAFEDENLQALQLPFKGGDLSLLILLPRTQDGLAGLEQQLTAPKLAEYVSDLKQYQVVDVALPRFKVEFDLPLSNELQQMGMRDAFNPGAADFWRGPRGEHSLSRPCFTRHSWRWTKRALRPPRHRAW